MTPGPLLLGATALEADDQTPWTTLPPYYDEEQVEKDVNRSFVSYPKVRSNKELQGLRDDLTFVILSILRRYPYLRYFQGYHDIVQVLLLVLGRDAAVPCARRLSLIRIRDFMVGSDVSAAEPQLKIIPAILRSADRTLYEHLKPTNPFYALASTLTLYAHTIDKYADIARLFDYFLAQDATAPLYLFAAIILQRRDELLELDPVEDVDIVTFTIQKLPPDLDLEALIERARELKAAHPPTTLPLRAWSRVSGYSVLKTTQNLEDARRATEQEAELIFARQAREVRRRQMVISVQRRLARSAWKTRMMLLKNKRPAAFVTLAVTVGILALWLGRGQKGISMNSGPSSSYMQQIWTHIAGWI